MLIEDVLTKNVCYVSPQTTLEDVAKMMKEQECGSIPVAKDDRMIGMITDRDNVLRYVAASQDPQTMTAEQLSHLAPFIISITGLYVVRVFGTQGIKI